MNHMRNERALQALLKAAVHLDWRRIHGVLGKALESAVPENGKLPDALIEMAVADGGAGFLTMVLANRALTADQLEAVFTAGLTELDNGRLRRLMYSDHRLQSDQFQTRLAATGHPGLIGDLGGTGYFDRAQWRNLLAATGQAGAAVMPSNRWSSRLRAGVVSPKTEVVWHVLRMLGVQLSVAEQLTGVRSLLAAGVAPAEVTAGATLRPEVVAVVADLAAGAEPARLDAAIAAAEGSQGFIAELYDREITDIRDLIAVHKTLDWDALTAAARKKAFTKDATGALVAREDCPDALRDALFARHPAEVVGCAARVGPSLPAADCPARSRAKATRENLARALGRTVSGTQALQHGRTARAVLESLRGKESDEPDRMAAIAEFRTALGALFAEWPVADVAAWRRLRELLPEFGGTVSELLDTARRKTGAGAPIPGPAWERDPVHAAFLTLLDAAPGTAHAALLPGLPRSVQYDLICGTTWRREWVDISVASGDPKIAEWVARYGVLDAEEIDPLATVGTGWVFTQLLNQPAHTKRQRTAWLKSTAGSLREQLQRQWDQHCLDHQLIKGTVPQLRFAAGIWQADGPEQVRRLLPSYPFHNHELYVAATAILTELLARPDTEAALAELHGLIRKGESADVQVEAWRTRRDLAALAEEHHVWDWDALEAAHAERPFSLNAVYRMAQLDGCPEGLREAAKTVLPPRSHRAYTALMAGKDLAKVLRANPADDTDRSGDPWVLVAVTSRRLVWEDVLSYAHPAEAVLECLVRDPGRETGGPDALGKLVVDRLTAIPRLGCWQRRCCPIFPAASANCSPPPWRP